MLSLEQFKRVVANTPLFAIDLVVINEQRQILLGRRKMLLQKVFGFYRVVECLKMSRWGTRSGEFLKPSWDVKFFKQNYGF